MKKMITQLLEKLGYIPKSQLDYVYTQRNIAALACAYIARFDKKNFDVSFYRDNNPNWDDDWRMIMQVTDLVVNRQISWHLDPESAFIAKALFVQQKNIEWDGTDFSKTFEFIGAKQQSNE